MRVVGTHTVEFEAPSLPEQELARRHAHGPDACELDDERFFVRGQLEVPVSDTDEPLVWLVWVSVSAAAYVRLNAPAEDDRRTHFGWLASDLTPAYEGTIDLRTTVHPRFGAHPLIVVESHSHPLAIDQREGLTFQRLHELQHVLDFESVRTCPHHHHH